MKRRHAMAVSVLAFALLLMMVFTLPVSVPRRVDAATSQSTTKIIALVCAEESESWTIDSNNLDKELHFNEFDIIVFCQCGGNIQKINYEMRVLNHIIRINVLQDKPFTFEEQ